MSIYSYQQLIRRHQQCSILIPRSASYIQSSTCHGFANINLNSNRPHIQTGTFSMETVSVSAQPLHYSLKPRLYSVKLKEVNSKNKVVVMLQVNGQSRDISTWQDIRVEQPILNFKVIIFSQAVTTTYKSLTITSSVSSVPIDSESAFSVECVQINSVKESPLARLFKLSQGPSEGYEKYKEFRRKVKKMESITSPLNWKISFRLKLLHDNNVEYMDIDSTQEIIVDFGKGALKVQLEEVAWLNSPEDYMATVISDQTVVVNESSEVVLKFTQYLSLKFKLEKIVSTSSITQGLMSLRVLETTSTHDNLKITIKNNTTLESTLSPLFTDDERQYYDVEYYHLLKNLQQIQSNSSRDSASFSTLNFKIFKELRQLTPAFPNYPHLKNQILTPIISDSLLTITSGDGASSMKVYGLMDGLNSIQLPNGYIRFFVQFHQQQTRPQTDQVRLFSIKVCDIWNIHSLPNPLKLKILNNNNTYAISLISTQKDLKTMLYQNELYKGHQLSVVEANKTVIVSKKEKYCFVQLPHTNFYIQESKDSEFIHLQLSHNEDVLYAGKHLLKDLGSGVSAIVPLESMSSNSQYTFAKISCQEVPQLDNSVKSLYKMALSLECRNPVYNSYDLVIRNPSTQKEYKKKIGVKKTYLLEDTELALIAPTEECHLEVSIRRHHFDEIREQYVSLELFGKNIYLNTNQSPGSEDVCLQVKPNKYSLVRETLLDQEYGSMALTLQITHCKGEFLDRQNHLYSLKVPKQFWQNLKESFKNINSVTFEVMGSKKQRKSKCSKTKELMYMDSSQFSLPLTDYRDSLAVTVNDTMTGFTKVFDLMTARVQQPNKEIVFDSEGEWNLGAININEGMFLFVYTFKQGQDQSDNESVRTVSKSKEKTKKGKSINLNKTMKIEDTQGLKQQINSIVQENRMLVTKAVRLESNNTVLNQKLKQLEQISQRKKVDLKYAPKVAKNPNQANNSSKYRAVCGCGSTENLLVGYCGDCIQQLEKTYGHVYKLFAQKAEEYEKVYFQKVLKKEKISKLQSKIKSLKEKLMMRDSLEETDEPEDQSQHILSDEIASLKNQISGLNLRSKNFIESSSSFQESLETRVNQATRSIFSMMQQVEEYKHKNREIDELIKAAKST